MVRLIKILIAFIVVILIISIIASIFLSENKYQTLDTSEKHSLIENNQAIRGGETSQNAIINKEVNETERSSHSQLSDKTIDDAIEFLFASLELNNVDQFIFSFNIEIILIEYQSLEPPAKRQIEVAMQEISRDNSIKSVKYKKLKDNQVGIKILYNDEKEAEVILDIARAESINFRNKPLFYHIMTPPSDIINQINNTIQETN